MNKSIYEILQEKSDQIVVSYKDNAPYGYKYCIKCNYWKFPKFNINFPVIGFGETLLEAIDSTYKKYKEKEKVISEKYKPLESNYEEYSSPVSYIYVESVKPYYKDKLRIVKPGYISEDYFVDEYGLCCILKSHKPKIKGKKYYPYQKNYTIPYNRNISKKEFYKEIKDTL